MIKKPAVIWPHLIPFLFNEMEGDMSASTPTKRVKLIKLSKSSNLGLFILLLLQRSNPEKEIAPNTSHSFFISIEKNKGLQAHKATIFSRHRSNTSALELTEEDNHSLNNYLEYQMRTCLINYINGYVDSSMTDNIVREAIRRFMVRHELFDFDIDPETFRVMYYNNKNTKSGCLLSYQQSRSINPIKTA